MRKRSFDPEKVVILGPNSHGVRIEDDALVIAGSRYPQDYPADSPLTPTEKYARNKAGVLDEILASYYESPLPLDDQEKEVIEKAEPDLWSRFQKAATRILSQNGYMPPVYEQTASVRADTPADLHSIRLIDDGAVQDFATEASDDQSSQAA